MKTLNVTDPTHKDLMLIKIQSKAKNLDEVIRTLLKGEYRPARNKAGDASQS